MSYNNQNEDGSRPPPDDVAEQPGGFRSFWKKTDDTNQAGNLTFVQQDPSDKKSEAGSQGPYHFRHPESHAYRDSAERSRIGRLFRAATSSSAGESATSEESGKSEAQKRRQQVYQAQKRHRNRKAEYVKNLEEEIARLQHLDALTNSEKNVLAHQNQAIREFLNSQSLDIQLDSMNLNTSAAQDMGLSALGGAALDIRFDPDVGHDRVFMDLDDFTGSDLTWTSGSSTQGELQATAREQSPVKGDSWAALDFILALEWPCKDHVHHPAINPDPQANAGTSAAAAAAAAAEEFTGHALTTTAAVYQSALPPPAMPGVHHDHYHHYLPLAAPTAVATTPTQASTAPESSRRWQLPHSEIDKLVMLSEKLGLDDEQLTPAQAYAAVRAAVPAAAALRPALDALKVPLGALVHCTGIGAILPADLFWQQLELAMQSVHASVAPAQPPAAVV